MSIEHVILIILSISNIVCILWGLTEHFLKEGAEDRLKIADEHIDLLKQTIKIYEERRPGDGAKKDRQTER